MEQGSDCFHEGCGPDRPIHSNHQTLDRTVRIRVEQIAESKCPTLALAGGQPIHLLMNDMSAHKIPFGIARKQEHTELSQ
ncbi:MAG: hypothetical protein K6U02_03305 [Firmicutes bacterium]|nr:hypothetical protein [Bacillota bacterium]